MSLFMILRIGLKALGRNKMRTSLTMLGLIIGVAAVITMVALGSGAQQSIEDQITSAGTNMISVSAGNFSSGGVRHGWGSATTLSTDDAKAIREQVQGVQYVAAGVNIRAQVVSGNQNWSTRVQGTDVEFPLIRFWPTEFGTFFSPSDVSASAKVAVLGSIVRDTLFGEGADPVGQTIRIRRQPFKVIGVMAVKGPGSFGEDQDDTIFVPFTTVQKKLRGIRYIQSITVSAMSAGQTVPVSDEISALLRVQHNLIPGDEDDFRVRTLEEMANVRSEATRTMTSLLASIAGVSLLVGGIGIMNIMLVSVTERTREIGLRMAVGAKGQDVLFQFLVEAVVLSLLGGAIGIALGLGLSRGITQFLEWPTTVSLDAVIVAFGFAAITGIFFGFYPARKAAQLDPIESLRFE
jgi:putative ABC transport system permease protein